MVLFATGLGQGIEIGIDCFFAFATLLTGFLIVLSLKCWRQLSRFRKRREGATPAIFDRSNALFYVSLAIASVIPIFVLLGDIASKKFGWSFFLPFLYPVIAFFAGFFSRTVAKVFSGMMVAIHLNFILMVAIMNSWDFGFALSPYLYFSRTTLINPWQGSLLLALVAYFAPLRRSGKQLPDGSRTTARPRWAIFIPAFSLAMGVCGYVIWMTWAEERGEKNTMELLSGDRNVHFDRIEIEYQQRRVICTDPKSLEYLEGQFRTANRTDSGEGTLYRLTVHYQDEGQYQISTNWGDTSLSLSLIDYHDKGKRPSHEIMLSQPRPESIGELVAFLKKDHQDVSGTVMIMELGGIRYERDDALTEIPEFPWW